MEVNERRAQTQASYGAQVMSREANVAAGHCKGPAFSLSESSGIDSSTWHLTTYVTLSRVE